MAKSHLKLISPATENRTVATPLRRKNKDLCSREYLTDAEGERLTEAAKGNRYGHRDATIILVAYRHGLRAVELADLRWDQINFDTATLAVRRAKKDTKAHPAPIQYGATKCGRCDVCTRARSLSGRLQTMSLAKLLFGNPKLF